MSNFLQDFLSSKPADDDIDAGALNPCISASAAEAQIDSEEESMGCEMDVDADEEDNADKVEEEEEEEEIPQRRQDAISHLENLALSFLSQLTDAFRPEHLSSDAGDGESCRPLPKDRKRRIVLELANRRSLQMKTRIVHFPRNIKGSSAKPLAQLLRVIDEAHEALINDVPITKRDLYYRDVALFKKQSKVDAIVDDLAATFALNRSDLNIRASSKGLYCGSALTIHLNDGTVVEGKDNEASLIPAAQDIEQFEIHDDITWILIVEKDAVFQTLRHAGFIHHPALPGPGLLITGKGYPDVATRQLVKSLSDNLPERIRILALVDADAYGIDIVSVYKYGSASMHHEKDSLVAERVEWIGVSTSEALSMGVDRDSLLPMSACDSRKALSLLRSNPNLPAPWKRELMQMLHTRRKAEIEILSNSSMQRSSGLRTSQEASPYSASSSDSLKKSDSPLLRYLTWKINEALEY